MISYEKDDDGRKELNNLQEKKNICNFLNFAFKLFYVARVLFDFYKCFYYVTRLHVKAIIIKPSSFILAEHIFNSGMFMIYKNVFLLMSYKASTKCLHTSKWFFFASDRQKFTTVYIC